MPRKGVRLRLSTKRKRSHSISPPVPKSRPSVKRKTWTQESMAAALKTVAEGTGVNKAARDHGVPATTLRDRVSGKVKVGSKPGPKPYLEPKEEKELGSFLKECANVGYGRTRSDVMHVVESIAREKGVLRKNRITRGWWNRYLQRQGDLSLGRGDSTGHVRMDAINRETINQYFDLLKNVLDEYDLLASPAQIYNVDESGMPFDFKTPNVVAKTGSKKVRYRQTGRKGQVTIVACANAIGQAIPPMIIFDSKNLNHAWTKDEVPGTRYGLSDNGWINTDLFEGWLSEHFIEYAVPGRPILLLLDGHSTHYQLDVVTFAKTHNIIMLCLPPHTTHESQPLDCGVFKPLKNKWTEVCHRYFQKNPGKLITKFNFNLLFSQAWLKALIPSNIVAGFKTCGVYPFNQNAISVPGDSSDDDGDDNDKGAGKDLKSSNSSSGEASVLSSVHTGSNQVGHVTSLKDTFSEEQVILFENRFKEGYNLFIDQDYVHWLELHHPEALPPDRYDLTSAENNSLTELFSDITPESPLPLSTESSREVTAIPESPPEVTTVTDTPVITSVTGTSKVTATVTPNVTPAVSVLLKGSSSSGSSGERIISKYLDSPLITTPKRGSKSLPRAKLLTSNESLLMLKEKEKKKQEEIEQKEVRKKEREEKKKKRELELQRKAEERVIKAKEKVEKENERKRKAEEKAQKITEEKAQNAKKTGGKKKKRTGESAPKHGASAAGPSAPKQRKTRESTATELETIDTNMCCMCFGNYDDDVLQGLGANWICCACGRWLHEDCVEDCERDDEGNDRICPFCLDVFST